MDKRKLKLDDYGISSARYKELCGFCQQYPEWLDELEYNTDTLKSNEITDMPKNTHANSDQTGELAMRRVELRKKCELVEQTAIESDAELYPYIIKCICYELSLKYLESVMGMPCSRAAFYDKKRYFFYLLDKRKKI